MRLVVLLISLMFVWPARAEDIAEPGDLVIAGMCQQGIGVILCGAFAEVRRPDGSYKFKKGLPSNDPLGSTYDVLYDPNGTVHILYPYEIRTHSSVFEQVGSAFFDSQAVALTMDQSRTIFVLFPSGKVLPLSPDGQPLSPIQVPVSIGSRLGSGDLGLDQCTLYYSEVAHSPTSRTARLRRYDLCRNVGLPDVLTSSLLCSDTEVRVARDGSVFIANCSEVSRVTTSGGVRTYALPGSNFLSPWSIALTQDGRSFWSVSLYGTTLLEVDVATGAILRTLSGAYGYNVGLAIYGTPRSAVLANLNAIPTVSHLVLAMIAIGAITVGWTRLG